jgi:hypothetical protein
MMMMMITRVMGTKKGRKKRTEHELRNCEIDIQ